MTKFIVGAGANNVFQQLHDAGLLPGDPNFVRRCIIDLEVGSAAKIYYEMFADDVDGKVGDILVAGLAKPKEKTNVRTDI